MYCSVSTAETYSSATTSQRYIEELLMKTTRMKNCVATSFVYGYLYQIADLSTRILRITTELLAQGKSEVESTLLQRKAT